MKLARAILTHRQDLIPHIKRYYLESGKTDFLIIAYNQLSVDPKKFEQTENFKLFPYLGKGSSGSIVGQMFLVWADLAKNFPEVEKWIIHDYDVIVKPTDEELAAKVGENEYGMVGTPFVYNQETIADKEADDLYPFLKSGLNLSLNNQTYKSLEKELLKTYKAVLTGYGDFIVASSKDLALLGQEHLRDLPSGGAEQVPHTVFAQKNIKPKDLKKYFSCFVSLDNSVYADFESKYDISHPSKFWPGFPKPGLKLRIRRFLKLLLTDSRKIRRVV
jgi:hypothetical protein